MSNFSDVIILIKHYQAVLTYEYYYFVCKTSYLLANVNL